MPVIIHAAGLESLLNSRGPKNFLWFHLWPVRNPAARHHCAPNRKVTEARVLQAETLSLAAFHTRRGARTDKEKATR
jgi:hypothetical protein